MSKAAHQVLGRCTRRCGQSLSRVSQVVETEPIHTGLPPSTLEGLPLPPTLDPAPARKGFGACETGKIDHTCDVGADGAVSTPAVDRDLVAEASRTVGRADEIDLRRRGRPFLLRLPESADGGNP
jgi:hypothetical protein